ncbi:MAG: phosphate ABC transporter permease PstA [Hyphomicrobium sp.]
MTDAAATSLDSPAILKRRAVPPEVAAARVRKRYASERLFKFLGIGALVLTGLFLVALLTNIVWNALPAFWEHRAVLNVAIDPAVVDPDGKRSREALKSADYASLTRRAIETAIPGIEGRTARKSLTGLVSSGAADDLRDRVLADPTIIGQTVKMPLLLSDDADIYFKSDAAKVDLAYGSIDLKPSDAKGDIVLKGTVGAFANLINETKVQGAETDVDSGDTVLTSSIASRIVMINGGLVKIERVTANELKGRVLMPLATADLAKGGAWQIKTYAQPESRRKAQDQDVAFLEKLRDMGAVEKAFNWRFFTSGDSREPELAGIRGALVGTALTLLVTLIICLPIGVLAAIYLEEFAPKNRLTDIIEVNINNLAAVPSIVFGLLGLAVFLNFFNLPRSAPLVGGLVLALLVLPTIIIASRAAIKAVPPSIREAAIGLGASQQQAVFHHVLPLAMPGIMTGAIIGMAHALGETAPLLMIGMIAFIVDVPASVTDAATVLPVQIYLWSDLPEAAFQQRTAAAIVVLLGFLFAMNGAAIWLRNKFERRW